MVTSDIYGKLGDGREVRRFTIANKKGEYVQLLEYGATIHSLYVLDRNANLGDVVLGASCPEELEHFSRGGRVIGRCANRIRNGRFTIGEGEYQLQLNDRDGFIHGGSDNYGKKLFAGSIDGESVLFRLYDSDTVGFGCDVEVQVRYSFDDLGRLNIDYEMTAESDTVLNPTNHAYFDLSLTGDIRDHELWLVADERVTFEAGTKCPDGGVRTVHGTPADFTTARTVRAAMDSDDGTYFEKGVPFFDEFYILPKNISGAVAELYAPNTGRGMRVYTDMPSLVVYTDPGKTIESGKFGRKLASFCGICLETGFAPNAVNCPQYKSPVFSQGASLKSTTVYEFFTR